MTIVCVAGLSQAVWGTSAVPARPGLVAYWDFNQLSGTTLGDAAGNSDLELRCDRLAHTFHQKEYVSGLVPGREGLGDCLYLYNLKPEHGLYKEKASAWISNPDLFRFPNDEFTITGWFQSREITAGYGGIVFSFTDAGGFSVLIGRTGRSNVGKLLFGIKGPSPISIQSDRRVDDDQWHWFGAVSDGYTISLYVDGQLQKQTAEFKPGATTEISGSIKSIVGDGYTGCIDELAVYHVALGAERLQQIYTGGQMSVDVPEKSDSKIVDSRSCGIEVKEKVLFNGWEGLENNGLIYRLACGASVSEMPNGDLVAWCLTGTDNEPATDNCVIMTRSTDGGAHWSNPEIHIESTKEMMVGLNAMYALPDDRVVSILAYLYAEKKYTEWFIKRRYSSDNGKTWGETTPFKVGDNNVCVGRPLHLANGEYLFYGTVFDEREKPLVAPVADLLKVETEAEALALPAGEGKQPKKMGTHLIGCCSFTSKQADGTDLIAGGKVANRPLGMLEPTCVQLKDGRIAMLMRAQFGKYLWRSDSHDNGRTWSDAWKTDIPNPASLPSVIRLPDGRIALINNNSHKGRDPLSVWVSNDEMESWYLKKDVIAGGMLAYPHAIVLKNGNLVFVYDHNRRQMRFVEVELPRP